MKVDLDEFYYDNRRRPGRRATGDYERDDDGHVRTDAAGQFIPVTQPMTIADVFIEALTDRQTDEREIPRDKLRRARLSDLMLDGGMVELNASDVAMIQQRASALTATAYLRVVEVLGDPDAPSAAVENEDDLASPEPAVSPDGPAPA